MIHNGLWGTWHGSRSFMALGEGKHDIEVDDIVAVIIIIPGTQERLKLCHFVRENPSLV